MLILTLPLGLLVGLSLGALGAGGSILTVPALVYLIGLRPAEATTMSLIIVGGAALAGAVAHGRAGHVRLGQGVVFGLLGAAGAVAGSKAGTAADPDVLLLCFAGLMILAATAMFARQRGPQPRPDTDGRSHGPATPSSAVATATRTHPDLRLGRALKVTAAATTVGLLTGFFGVGGGFAVIPALVLVLGYDAATAVGTSLVVITFNSAVALLARLGSSAAGPDWQLLALFLLAALAGVLAGNRIALRVAPRRLAGAFAVMLILVATYTAARSLIGLV